QELNLLLRKHGVIQTGCQFRRDPSVREALRLTNGAIQNLPCCSSPCCWGGLLIAHELDQHLDCLGTVLLCEGADFFGHAWSAAGISGDTWFPIRVTDHLLVFP